MSTGKVRFVTASDGIKLAAHVKGEGPPLYALHGGPANDRGSFGSYLDPVAAYRELWLLDQRGCGESDDGSLESYTLERLAQDIEDTRQSLGHQQIEILGHSLGGVLALSYAIRWPRNVEALVLVCAPVRGWRGVVSDPGSWPLWGRVMFEGFRKTPDWTSVYLKHELRGYPDVGAIRDHICRSPRYDAKRLRPFMMAGSRPIDVKVIVGDGVKIVGIYGSLDRRFRSAAAYLQSIGVPVQMIDGASHFPFVEQHESFHEALGRVLQEEAAPGSPE